MIQKGLTKIYKAPKGKIVQSFLITMIDGTGSMNYEYEEAVKAHDQVFSYLGNNKENYQFTQQLHPGFLPFQCSGSGDITNAFEKILTSLINNQQKYQKYVTIIFLSDGEEKFVLKQLEGLIQEVKKIYQIKFISVAVGSSFPYVISNDLRNQLHTEDDSVPSMLKVKRDPSKSEDEVREIFVKVFEEINKEINFQEAILNVNIPVSQNILEPDTTMVKPDTTFLVRDVVGPVLINGEEQEATKNKEDVIEHIEKIAHAGFIKGRNDTYQEIFEKIEQGISEIVQHYPEVDKPSDAGPTKVQQVLALVDSINNGDLNLDQLTDDQKTKLQDGLFNEKVNLVTEVLKCSDTVKAENLTEKIINDRIKEKYKQIKAGCYVRGKHVKGITQQQQTTKELSKLDQVVILVGQSLQDTLQALQQNQQLDYVQVLQQFKDRSFESMNSVFKAQDFQIQEDEEIEQLKYLNNIFEQIHRVIIKQITLQEFVNQKYEIEKNSVERSALFQTSADFYYLPQELQLLYQELTSLEDAEKIFLLLVDQTETMAFEEATAFSAFSSVFQNVPQNLKIIMSFKQKEVFLHNNQKQQPTSFKSILNCLQSIEKDYDLKTKRIHICLVSDGKSEDYQVIHKQFKVTRFHYSIQLIYFTIGGLLRAQIEGNMKRKYQNRNVKGCPKLINIPRKLNQSVNQRNDLEIQFIKLYEELLRDFIGQPQSVINKKAY